MEYVRNLARLRFNHITFHSYPNQWIDGPQNSSGELAGSFFYGHRHDLPNHPLRTSIRNSRTFCIPEIEPWFDQPEERSRRAIAWLNELMRECKRVGMKVQFSFEPRQAGEDLDLTLATARHVLDLYPHIDTLELITTESGGGTEILPADFGNFLKKRFGQQGADVDALLRLIDKADDGLTGMLGQLDHNLRASARLAPEIKVRHKSLSVGVYYASSAHHQLLIDLVDGILPADVAFALLPGHSSRICADYVEKLKIPARLRSRLLLYSWIEFDGVMYLQQNGISGLARKIGHLARTPGAMPDLAFNHWRLSENRSTSRFASESCLHGACEPDEFHRREAAAYGIQAVEAYLEAMRTLDRAEAGLKGLHLVGFCYTGCWKSSYKPRLGIFGLFDPEKVKYAQSSYRQADAALSVTLASECSAAGKTQLRFLQNRVRTSIVYLDGIAKGAELRKWKDRAPDSLSTPEKEELVTICREAILRFDQYLRLWSEELPDRGAEGTLISAYYTPPTVLRMIMDEYAGVEMNDTILPEGEDAPPDPVSFC